MRGWYVLTAIAIATGGCRIGFDAHGDDASALGCWPAWRDGTIAFDAVARIDELATGANEANPYLTADGRTLYFDRPGAANDLLVATRSGVGQPFGEAIPVSALNTDADEGRLSIAGDGATGFFNADRPGGAGGSDVWTAHRTEGGAFAAPTQDDLAAVNTAAQELDPEISSDGLALYLAPYTGGTDQWIAVARRGSVDDPFGAPERLTELDISPGLGDPAVSPDQLVIVFAAGATGDANDMYYAARAARTDPFGPPVIVPTVNSAANDGDTTVSADGCELVFASARGSAGDQRDLYRATARPSN